MCVPTHEPTSEHEQPYWNDGLLVAGIDEAGRGALAGPVVAAAVVFHPMSFPEGLNDSKVLKPDERAAAALAIKASALAWRIAFVDNHRIDTVNILQATYDAMWLAIDGLAVEPHHLLVDGNRFRAHRLPSTTIIDGDALSVSIAAASILAKTARDAWMAEEAHVRHPAYGFDRHKGYGTVHHREAIRLNGPCVLHRHTFLGNL